MSRLLVVLVLTLWSGATLLCAQLRWANRPSLQHASPASRLVGRPFPTVTPACCPSSRSGR